MLTMSHVTVGRKGLEYYEVLLEKGFNHVVFDFLVFNKLFVYKQREGMNMNEIDQLILYSDGIDRFIAESNRIEGYSQEQYDIHKQRSAYFRFLSLPEVKVSDIVTLARTLQSLTAIWPGEPLVPELRSRIGMNVRVGNHIAPLGGPEIRKELKKLLKLASELSYDSKQGNNPYDIHIAYEQLHPLTDCNGRTGRALWAWQMYRLGYEFKLTFLHMFYYQTLRKFQK